ncbi:MAG: DUF177 domain-containing protein [Rikenellaceae bacterium]|nr:DUF177 domain-containing protein [Rikenellaceae bacterium]MCL2692188.1 DUF177 domain-containing protein [Rikenellaceae bacterium]
MTGLGKKYAISFRGLGEGRHEYVFPLDDSFFRAFEGSEIMGGAGEVCIALDKSATILEIGVRIEAEVGVECDRCLEECRVPVEYEGGFRVRFGETEKEEFDGELMWLGHGESELDMAQYIYESIVLALPYKRVHDGESCGEVAGVRLITEEEFERAAESSEMQRMEDNPEWQKLRELRDKLENK